MHKEVQPESMTQSAEFRFTTEVIEDMCMVSIYHGDSGESDEAAEPIGRLVITGYPAEIIALLPKMRLSLEGIVQPDDTERLEPIKEALTDSIALLSMAIASQIRTHGSLPLHDEAQLREIMNNPDKIVGAAGMGVKPRPGETWGYL